MRLPDKRSEPRPAAPFSVAAEDARRLAEEATARVDRALESDWYREHGGVADHAVFVLCRLRRASAGERGGPESGDGAVRDALAAARPEALLWLASRAIAYMDEAGFPEDVEAWIRHRADGP